MDKLSSILEQATLSLREGVEDPSIFKVVFLAGGPGAGKSFTAGRTTAGLGFRVVNSDDVLSSMLRKSGLGLDMNKMSPEQIKQKDLIRVIAKRSTAKRLSIYTNGRLGLIIDGTGKDFKKIKGQKEELESIGYDTAMVFVNTTLDVALERNRNRERVVPEDKVREFWTDVQSNLGKFQSLFGSKFIIVDNSVVATDDKLFTMVFKKVRKFANAPITNTIAKGWIASEREKKRRT